MKSQLALNIEQRKRDLNIKTNIELAKMSGVSRAVITNIQLQPEKSIMLDSGMLLAKALQCRLEWLATGEGPINLDDVERHQRAVNAAPVVTIAELKKKQPKAILEESIDDFGRERIPCAAGSNETTFVIRLTDSIGKYWAGGLMFFDADAQPMNGKPVIVNLDGEVEIMEYVRAHGRTYFKSMNDDIPQELKFFEKTDETHILASYTAFSFT